MYVTPVHRIFCYSVLSQRYTKNRDFQQRKSLFLSFRNGKMPIFGIYAVLFGEGFCEEEHLIVDGIGPVFPCVGTWANGKIVGDFCIEQRFV